MTIGYDKAQKEGKHNQKHNDLIKAGHTLMSIPCPVGDYIVITDNIKEVIKRRGDKLKKMDLIGLIDISIDTKKDIEELYQCLIQDHKRFSDSCFLAHNNNIKLIILIENKDGVTKVDNLNNWKNERGWKRYFFNKKRAERTGSKLPKPPVKPSQLKQIMWTMNKKYGVEFMFCKPSETAGKIIEILGDRREKDV